MQCAAAEQCRRPCLDKSLFARHDDGIPLQAQGRVLFPGSLSELDRTVFGTRLLACHPAARSGGPHDMRRPQRRPCFGLGRGSRPSGESRLRRRRMPADVTSRIGAPRPHSSAVRNVTAHDDLRSRSRKTPPEKETTRCSFLVFVNLPPERASAGRSRGDFARHRRFTPWATRVRQRKLLRSAECAPTRRA
ncbi:hypothetical protein HPB50_002255 [Hyalomma asiaticum]|uniref:Uncharacterized protein n=1 Tax=Hyalomma asiaticum TaxID=266040 RepID=A0ACB7TAU4_HYAAI|nr:hypothetical protein HPB50_002255 [Hyalomma asiaticum]